MSIDFIYFIEFITPIIQVKNKCRCGFCRMTIEVAWVLKDDISEFINNVSGTDIPADAVFYHFLYYTSMFPLSQIKLT